MFATKSYIKYPHIIIKHFKDAQEEYFINVNDLNEILRIKNDLDLDYLEGAIYLTYKNQILIDFCHYDMVDQLWAYFMNMIEEFLETKNSEMSFPDQPTPISMDYISDDYILFAIGFTQWKLPKYEFFKALLLGAKDFFEKMILILEEKDKSYQFQLKRIKLLEQKINTLKQ